MVYETLQILKEQLENYLDNAGLGKIVVLENLALLDSGSDKAKNLEGKVIISLLSVQEESTLKNLPTSHVVNNKAEYYNPAVNINLFFMVSANCEMYSNSLISITKTLEYFQGKKVFTAQNTAYNRSNVSMQELDDFKFVVDLYTPGFEVWNQIWGTHGGRQLPSVIYKVQLLQVDRRKKQASTELITKVKGTLKDIN
ncbi:DUF4255 domain-containing protein [Draconibacterium sediminis]|uniref:DUF4255 domain-containing protein n=1 Tax=Draconibacterium sediminis TaxID=1544798 RepID=UPI0026F1ACA2|nr:DUF4255 domain-containing protein [Draconibacterium sediminis]